MTTCFVAGIVKGLVEHNDPLRHFASFGGYGHHACAAIAAGLVDVDDSRPCERVKINDAGREYYKAKTLICSLIHALTSGTNRKIFGLLPGEINEPAKRHGMLRCACAIRWSAR